MAPPRGARPGADLPGVGTCRSHLWRSLARSTTSFFIDGIYLPYKWVLLTAVNQRTEVVARQWAARENAAAYTELLKDLPPPMLITCDGAGGALAAIHAVWGADTPPVQRCLIHVHRNSIRDLTNQPKTTAGQALKALSKRLLIVRTLDHAAAWTALLAQFHSQYNDWLSERTYAVEDPVEARRRGKTRSTHWWYTHTRDRRVYTRLERLSEQGTLFTFPTVTPGEVLHATTNIAESLNAVCYHHRGLSQTPLLAAIDWVLYYQWIAPRPTHQIYTRWTHTGRPHRRNIPTKQQPDDPRIGPALYDTGLSADEGLRSRKGWAGRS